MSINLITPEMRANFRNLYADVFWYGILAGSSMAFLAVFAARQGATSFQVSLLSAGPAVMNLALSLPVGRWLEGRHLARVTFWSAFWQRSGYLILILVPWLLPTRLQVWMLILITLLFAAPGAVLAISFNALFADVVAPQMRAQVVGRRNALLALSQISASLLSGQLLDRLSFPGNYQLVFLLGFIGAAMSTYHLARLKLPSDPAPRAWHLMNDQARPGLLRFMDAFRSPAGLRFLTRSSGKPLLRLDLLRTSFGTFMLACFFFYTFQYSSIPLYPLFLVNELRLTDGQISFGNALFYLLMMIASIGLGLVHARLTHRQVLILGALLFGLYPLLNGLAYSPALFWVASVAGGSAWAVTNVGLFNRLMERTPQDDRPARMALHNLALNLGILSGSLLGPLLAAGFGLREALLLNAGMRFLAGVVFILWG